MRASNRSASRIGLGSSPTSSGAAASSTVDAGAKPCCGRSNRPEPDIPAAIAVAPVTNRTANSAAIRETVVLARIAFLHLTLSRRVRRCPPTGRYPIGGGSPIEQVRLPARGELVEFGTPRSHDLVGRRPGVHHRPEPIRTRELVDEVVLPPAEDIG